MPKQRLKTIVVALPPEPVTYRQKFESWVASWYPGLKTRILTGIGAVGSFATVVQGYLPGIPTSKYITTERLAIATFIVFTLAYWARSLGERYNVPPRVEAGS